ncbi:glycoside hydrolase family 3 N-terminal domain-containing protein [Paenibacillus jilunlii]|uniref:Glycoside hydrolase family 3 N-terminal domain-containing protein n=1 Tax=Paenibacillus jilunlii TaxID=682956 RepID=A0ABR5T228_9BACL|nr:glycoside hydrolase family 3 N-terminal domain-containing protein [Paenibacillus jilunlii]KWX81434.1 hypothetical protein AML91_00015 [Paenibacillus jilunlii]
MINLPDNPGGGSSEDGYGEDSVPLGVRCASWVNGVPEEKVIDGGKHLAFNSMEWDRCKVSGSAGKRTEREVFLTHVKDCVDAGAGSVMSAYNLYHGVQCGHHDYLLNQVLTDEWDFDVCLLRDFAWGIQVCVDATNGGMDA